MYKSAEMPNQKGTTLYIRQGLKSKLYGVGVSFRQTITEKTKGGGELSRPSQSVLYLGMYDYWEDALEVFNENINKRLLNWR